ncbi:MAG: DUF4118 domain-containing protein [Lewinellaceae bacterium]|nr:DUF4118 domain-containing protein [Lewinellaceae bacterium]
MLSIHRFDWLPGRCLILMLLVSVLAMRLGLYPVLLAAVLSAAIWDYFLFRHFTFHVNDSADAMLGMYFIIALLNGVLGPHPAI